MRMVGSRSRSDAHYLGDQNQISEFQRSQWLQWPNPVTPKFVSIGTHQKKSFTIVPNQVSVTNF